MSTRLAKLSSGALGARPNGVLLPAIEEHLKRKRAQGDDEHRDMVHIHPSEACKPEWCPRASWYRIKGHKGAEEKAISMFMENIFEEGHDVHHKWQSRLWEMGLLAGMWGCYSCQLGWFGTSPHECPHCGSHLLYYNEVPLFREDLQLIGHADGEVRPNEDYPDVLPGLIEIKSVSLGTLRFEAPELYKKHQEGELRLDKVWSEIRRPFASHVRQAQLYMHCRGLQRIYVLYEWKPTQAVKEFELPYDVDLIADILDGCKDVVSHLSADEPPKRPGWALASEHKNCKACPYHGLCWTGEGHGTRDEAQPSGVGENRGRRIRRRPVARR